LLTTWESFEVSRRWMMNDLKADRKLPFCTKKSINIALKTNKIVFVHYIRVISKYTHAVMIFVHGNKSFWQPVSMFHWEQKPFIWKYEIACVSMHKIKKLE
jgi:hypothetical protein